MTLKYTLLRIESPFGNAILMVMFLFQRWDMICLFPGFWLNLHWPRFDMIDVHSYSAIFKFRNF